MCLSNVIRFREMKVITPLLAMLILESMSVSGSSDNPPDELVRDAVCEVRCGKDEAPEDCKNLCILERNDIPVLDIEAKANARIWCRDGDQPILKSNSGLFIIEARNQSTDWRYVTTRHVPSDESTFYQGHLSPGEYQLRFTQAFAEGISKSEITEKFTMPEADAEPTPELDLWIQCFNRYDQWPVTDITAYFHLRATTNNPNCYSVLSCYQLDEDDERTVKGPEGVVLLNSPTPDTAFSCGGLPLGTNFTIVAQHYVFGKRQTQYEIAVKNFSTPSEWPRTDKGSRPTRICVPYETNGINVIVIRPEKKTNIFNVHVTWLQPAYTPDFYIVTLTSDTEESDGSRESFLNISGTATAEATFEAVNISDQFNVSITGWSLLGKGPAALKTFTVPEEAVDQSGTIITISVLTSLLMVTGLCLYLIYRRRRERAELSKRKKDEIDPDRLTITRILGNGAFGVVKFGRLRDDNHQVTNVAVKMLRDDTNQTELRNFRSEIEMMKSLGKHPNIVSFIGYRSTGLYPFLVVEFCPRGDLLTWLRAASLKTKTSTVKHEGETCASAYKEDFRDSSETINEDEDTYIDTVVANRDTTVTLLDMLNFGRQIATGMEFLASKRIVHRDLAARNILLCDKRVVKISDFGLSRDIYQENVYRKTGNCRMPFKWMAIESLMRQVYTTQSDVWSFGILLWEIFTLGNDPYPEIPTLGLLKLLQSGYRMERPQNCAKSLYDVMRSCWEMKPRDRPTFSVLRKQLDWFICVAAEHKYLDADYVLVGMESSGEDSEPSSPCDFSPPLEMSSVDDPESSVTHKSREQAKNKTEDCQKAVIE